MKVKDLIAELSTIDPYAERQFVRNDLGEEAVFTKFGVISHYGGKPVDIHLFKENGW